MYHLIKKEAKKLSVAFLHPTFIFLTITGNTLLILASLAVYYLEKGTNPHIHTYFDSLWWGICTITTVAYGDIVPITTAGRIIGIILIYTGTVLFIAFTGFLLTFLMREEVEKEMIPFEKEIQQEEKEQRKIEKILEKINQRLERLEKK